MLKNKDIICISVSDWEKPWGSKQHLMKRLSADNRVLYVEYQSSLFDFLLYPAYSFRKLFRYNRLHRISPGLSVYTPLPMLPFGYYLACVTRINQFLLGLSLRVLMKRLGFVKPVLWSFTPSAVYLLGRLRFDKVIYHCGTDFLNEKNSYLRKRVVSRLEQSFAKKAAIVLTLSRGLEERLKSLNSNTLYFPSAVDMEYFSAVRDDVNIKPKDLAPIKNPLIGLIGYLDGNVLDIALLRYIARVRPQWSLVLIGPAFRGRDKLLSLRKYANVHFLGEKSPDKVAVYLKYLDVCLIPYVRNSFTENVSPIKLYEYLAMGKPVVATYFSEDIRSYEKLVRVASGQSQFENYIEDCLDHKANEQEFNQRIKFAQDNSWQRRLEFLSENPALS